MKASDIEAKLASKYLTEQAGWAFLREVTILDPEVIEARDRYWQTGLWREQTDEAKAVLAQFTGTPDYRRIDVLLMRTTTANPVPFERIAVEIKVSRGDFRRDTAAKRKPWMAVAHRFAYATPPGLVSKDEVPEGCGLIEVDPEAPRFQGCTWAKRAPRNFGSPEDFDARFVAYLAGRASRAEHELRTSQRAEVTA
jgi:hypothetical protein